MKNDYGPVGDMSYQEWRNLVDVREDFMGKGITTVSFKERLENPEEKIISWYRQLAEEGDKNLMKQYADYFKLKIEKK